MYRQTWERFFWGCVPWHVPTCGDNGWVLLSRACCFCCEGTSRVFDFHVWGQTYLAWAQCKCRSFQIMLRWQCSARFASAKRGRSIWYWLWDHSKLMLAEFFQGAGRLGLRYRENLNLCAPSSHKVSVFCRTGHFLEGEGERSKILKIQNVHGPDF